VAFAAEGVNFIWAHPSKSAYLHVILRVGEESQGEVIQKLEHLNIECGPNRDDKVKIVLRKNELETNTEFLRNLLVKCENRSRE
jgi:hypothetical protein